MAVFSSLRLASAVVVLAAVGDATTYLSPAQDIVLPASGSARNPLEWLGANGPYFAGTFSDSQGSVSYDGDYLNTSS